MAREQPVLEDMTLRQLRRLASEYGISRYSRMRKSQLLATIQEIQIQRLASVRPSSSLQNQEEAEAGNFSSGQKRDDEVSDPFASVDDGLIDLPGGYGTSHIILMPRDPEWAYAYWDIPRESKERLKRQGGQQLALRIYDVTNINLEYQTPHSIQEYPCDEVAREWYVPIPVSDRDYVVEIGYRCADGRWLQLARSTTVRIPPTYPSNWVDEQFVTVEWDEKLSDKKIVELEPGSYEPDPSGVLDRLFSAKDVEALRVAGSMFGSRHHVSSHENVVSSYIFATDVEWASGIGLTTSGVGLTTSGAGLTTSGVGLNASGMSLAVSGAGLTTSGVGINLSGLGLTTSGIGLTTSGSGLSASGIGHTMSGVGLTTSGIGLNISGLGLTTSGMGLTTSGIGINL
ncbi:MAG: DUF4912 domain-containing protein, partial [Microcoleaceae cyanobacterium]